MSSEPFGARRTRRERRVGEVLGSDPITIDAGPLATYPPTVTLTRTTGCRAGDAVHLCIRYSTGDLGIHTVLSPSSKHPEDERGIVQLTT